VIEVKREVIGLRENRSIKWMKAERRNTTIREEKLTIGFANEGETGKKIQT
jgi:hypothetical protein